MVTGALLDTTTRRLIQFRNTKPECLLERRRPFRMMAPTQRLSTPTEKQGWRPSPQLHVPTARVRYPVMSQTVVRALGWALGMMIGWAA